MENFSSKEETESMLEKFFQTLEHNDESNDKIKDISQIKLKSKNNYLLQLQNKEKSVYRWWILKKDKNSAVDAMSRNPLTTFLVKKITNVSNLMNGDVVIPLNGQCTKQEKKKENATLARVIEKNKEIIVVRLLHGENNGREHKIDRRDVCDEVMLVDYNFSEAEMSVYKQELESHVKKIPTVEESIEVELFGLCFQDPLDIICAHSIHTWKLLQLKKHDYICSTSIWNAKLFHARNWLSKIESFLRTLKLKRKRTDSIELEEQEFRQSGCSLLYKIIWLEIKAQSFNSTYAKLASECAKKAYKTLDIKSMKNHLVELQLLYKKGVGVKFDKNSKSRLHAFGLYKLTKSASKQLEKTYNEKRPFDFKSGGAADNFSTVLNFNQAEMEIIYSNVKNYMRALEKTEMMYSKVHVEKSRIGGQGVFPMESIQKYETIGIWSGELYGKDEENVFKNGGAKSDRNLYAIELNDGKSSFILDPDPKSYHSFPNDCRSAKHFHDAVGTLTKSEMERFKLGWLQFSYQGVPFMANVALKSIAADNSKNELFTYYGGNYVMNSLEKNRDDSKNRLEIIKNAGQSVVKILEKLKFNN
jgi:hypothetical protein